MYVFNSTIDILFFLDIILNFRSSYFDASTGEEVTYSTQIAKNYLYSGRLWIDLLASIPIDTIVEFFIEEQDSTLQLFGLLKLIRITRLGKIIS